MKASNRIACALALATSVFAGQAMAASWQDQLSSAANELSKSDSTSGSGSQSGALSLSSLTGLLNGGNQALSSNSMTNAAGILEYCAKNKLASATSAENIQSQLMTKLGVDSATKPAEQPDYNQGLTGLLNTGKDQQLDLNTIGSSPLAEQVKTKACDLVMKQASNYLS